VSSTTVRLSRQLHERLARRAEAEHTTLAGVIEHALDVQEREEFWAQAAITLGSAEAHQVAQAESVRMAGTLRDGLDLGETWDDVW
jgi:predicted transcriptional regulator